MSATFKLGGFELTRDAPPVFLAEIGGFFGQDIELASSMIRDIIRISRSVAHQPVVLKTEILHDVDICLRGDTLETYAAKDGRVRTENYRSLIERKVVTLEHYERLLAICKAENMPFVVSVYDFVGADFAAPKAAALKIASGNLVHIPLVRYCAELCAKFDLPLIIDTGRAALAEVSIAFDTIRNSGCEKIIVEHSPDGHPARPTAHNLRILQTYQQAFGVPVGISDHHVGPEMLYMSIALGASLLEKGVHVAPDDLDIDISHTIGMSELPRLLQTVYDCWRAMGLPARDKRIAIEGVIGTSQRAGLIAKSAMIPGDVVSLETIRFAFPCLGIPVQQWDTVNGWTLIQPVAAGAPILWSDVQKSNR